MNVPARSIGRTALRSIIRYVYGVVIVSMGVHHSGQEQRGNPDRDDAIFPNEIDLRINPSSPIILHSDIIYLVYTTLPHTLTRERTGLALGDEGNRVHPRKPVLNT